jgi:hypothetical protein
MPDPQRSLQELLNTNFGSIPADLAGYVGSQGSAGYVGSMGANGSNGILGYTGSVGANGTSAEPTITSIAYPGDDTAANTAGGDTITLTGSNFAAGATVVINKVQASVVAVVNSTTITFTAPAIATGSYIVYVVNTDGGTALLVPGIQYSGTPTWSTAAGSLGSVAKQSNFTANLAATGDAPVTYSIYSGSLPSGLTLTANTGVISGTNPNVSADTTYNFTVRATDAQQQDTDRAFSITVNNISGSTPTVEYLVVAGGGGGGRYGGGGGAGGFRTATGLAVSSGSAITVTVGSGGAGWLGDAQSGGNAGSGTNSVFGSIASIGGGGAGSYGSPNGSPGLSGGSGGGGAMSNGGGVKAGGAGTAGQGNAGGSGANTWPGDYRAGGGGGAGAAGTDGGNGTGGVGGDGLASSISGTAIYYAGGGGAGCGTSVPGGLGGGGAGSGGTNAGSDATVNTGGGGGGTKDITIGGVYRAGNGGSGIVIIRYPVAYNAATGTTGSPTITVTGGYRIYQWTSSGSITF